MYSIVRTFRFEAAHRLMKHKGCCSNIHGHGYKVEVEICSKFLNEVGMVVDFSDMKRVLDEVLENFDHSIILNASDKKVIDFCRENNFKWCSFDMEPTAENIAKILYDNFNRFLSDSGFEFLVEKVTVWETENCKASYSFER